jgi:exodeoxyribonuclease VII large subunit
LNADSATGALARFSVAELNGAIGTLIERGFAPRFLLEATVSRPQLKKGHLWLTLMDEEASIAGVVWASQLPRLSFRPGDGDGVTVVGKLNFWAARASLCVQVLDVRPSLSSVLRRFERVREVLEPTGIFSAARKRTLPALPEAIALLTSVPSAALADMLRTARERWPATRIVILPIPVQGAVEDEICCAIAAAGRHAGALGLEALVLARGGGSREDLSVFDGERLAQALATCPMPVITGLGHESDTTIADLVADYRAATPTAALVALLPDRGAALQRLRSLRSQLGGELRWRLQSRRQNLLALAAQRGLYHPSRILQHRRQRLQQLETLREALSPQRLLSRGFCLARGTDGQLVRSQRQVCIGQDLQLQWTDGLADVQVTDTNPTEKAVVDPYVNLPPS